jgi:hypothetical protein
MKYTFSAKKDNGDYVMLAEYETDVLPINSIRALNNVADDVRNAMRANEIAYNTPILAVVSHSSELHLSDVDKYKKHKSNIGDGTDNFNIVNGGNIKTISMNPDRVYVYVYIHEDAGVHTVVHEYMSPYKLDMIDSAITIPDSLFEDMQSIPDSHTIRIIEYIGVPNIDKIDVTELNSTCAYARTLCSVYKRLKGRKL